MVKITGHANPKSIKPYLQLDDEHHANLVEKMRDNETATSSNNNINVFVPTIGSFNFNSNSASSSTATESKHNNFYNCVFHCNSSCNF